MMSIEIVVVGMSGWMEIQSTRGFGGRQQGIYVHGVDVDEDDDVLARTVSEWRERHTVVERKTVERSRFPERNGSEIGLCRH